MIIVVKHKNSLTLILTLLIFFYSLSPSNPYVFTSSVTFTTFTNPVTVSSYSLIPCATTNSNICCSNKIRIFYYDTINHYSGTLDIKDTLLSFTAGCLTSYHFGCCKDTMLQAASSSTLACSDVPPIIISYPDSLENPCLQAQLANAAFNAQQHYNLYIDSLRTNFIAHYISHCKKFKELFTLQIPQHGFYHTIYLYDDNNNLLATIPPMGVDTLAPSQLTLVPIYRASNTNSLVPNHRKISHYRYNSQNLITAQSTPDAGTDTTIYDLMLRPAAHQNSRMKDSALWHFTKYDYLSRPIQTGIGYSFAAPNPAMLTNPAHPNNWLGALREITHTLYDKPYNGLPNGWQQNNLKSRISAVWRDEDNDNNPEHIYAYNYDVSGNVKDMYIFNNALASFANQGWKKIHYEYDLISGKVKRLEYQKNQADQWLHQFEYDILNRLKKVGTSRDNWYYEQDANYWYYLHRPLMRTEIGHRQVQGLDYVYSINGWHKTLNNYACDSVLDAGQDGHLLNHQYVARDVLGYQINYFNKDYKSVGLYSVNTFSNFVPLYNGNIGASIITQDTMKPMMRKYEYDVLNRLRGVDLSIGNLGNFFSVSSFRERLSYDRDGNIMRLDRWAKGGVMDSLVYRYYAGNNRLKQVEDIVSASTYSTDIDNQLDTNNYVYDKSGNLIEDKSEQLKLRWTYYGKLKQIDSAGIPKLSFYYDAMGNRVVKENLINNTKEIYIRDAQGNVIAVYEVNKKNNVDSLFTKEFYIYGSQRLGYLQDKMFLSRKTYGKTFGGGAGIPVIPLSPKSGNAIINIFQLPGTTSITPLYFGNKRYELTDWLGNVRVVIKDKKTPVNTGTVTMSYWPQVMSVSDYYSFGSQIAERSYDPVKPVYRFGFNTQEKVNEISPDHYTAKYWEYDARLGRRWNLDPKPQVGVSDYACLVNNPILFNDVLGDEIGVDKSIVNDKKAYKSFESFAKTKEGRKFLAKYAKAGQVIAGIKFDKDGEYHLKGIDLYYTLKTQSDMDGGGETHVEYKYDNNKNITGIKTNITLYTGKGWQTNNEFFNRAITIFHESFIHAALYADDFIDNKKIDYSNISKSQKIGAGMFPEHFHHSKVRMDFIRYGYNSPNLYPTEAFKGLISISKSWNLKLTSMQIQSAMWNFSGGLNLDPKTGENIDGKKK